MGDTTKTSPNAKGFAARAKETKEPLVLTINGKAELILQDAQSYQELLDRLELLETLAGIRKSLEEFERGEGMPAREAFAKLRQKHGLSKRSDGAEKSE
jgi:PHD/YefM family antitoxin component YafN of YafNO toxin-antitoxin module